MHYLIDGYNLAHWLAGDDDLSAHQLRGLLVDRLRRRVPRDAESIAIYWDVRRPSPTIPASEDLGFARAYNVPDADEAIIDAVWASDAPRRLLVVSRDREVTGKCRQLGAKTAGPVDLLGRTR